jgi:hypothetical protein
MEEQQTEKQEADNFIGFTHPKDEDVFIQFTRNSKTLWTIDIPKFENSEYHSSLSGKLSHDTVFSIVMDFFDFNSYFHQNLSKKNYNHIENECKSRWGIILETNQD